MKFLGLCWFSLLWAALSPGQEAAHLARSGDRNLSGQYSVGGTIVNVGTRPAAPLGATVSLATPAIVVAASCPAGPLGSAADTCTGTSAQNGGATATVTLKASSARISSIGITSTVSGATTTILDASKTVTRLLPGTTSNFSNPALTVDPISTASGGLEAGPFVDLSLGGPLPLLLRRFYSTAIGTTFGSGTIGANWSTNFDAYVGVSGNFAVVGLEGGASVAFQLSGGTYRPVYATPFAHQLVKVAAGFRFLNPESNLIYDFNGNGFLIKIEDRNGNAITVTQDTPGVTQVADGFGRTLAFSYTNVGSSILTSVKDQTGRTLTYAHDSGANLTKVTDANGNATSYSYSGNLLTKTVRARGNAPYSQTFDANGVVVSQTDSLGNATKLAFDVGNAPGLTKMTDPLGRSTIFNYADPTLVNLTSLVDAAGNTKSITYDAASRPLSFTDRLGNKTSVTYDATSGYKASSTDALGNTTTWTYQSQTQGDFTFYNLSKVGYADGTSEIFTYDASGNRLTATDRAGKKTAYTYNSAGQVLTEMNPAGGVTTTTYSADGTIATKKAPSGDVTIYSYDSLKRLAKIQYADGSSRSFTRDGIDQILTITDERGNVTKYLYDANNDFVGTTDALNKSTATAYDTDDLVSAATDRAGNSTTLQVDALGSTTALTTPGGEMTTYTYDNLERLQTIVDPNGKITTFGYDAEGRLTSRTDALGNTTKFQVDADGRASQTTSPLGLSKVIGYDTVGRVTSTTDALGQKTTIAYEGRGLTSAITAPSGITARFAWGDLPLLSSITDPNGNVWPITRDAGGKTTTETDPQGHALKYTYDTRGRVASATSPVDSVQLTYDAAGNVTKAQYSDSTALSYTYDTDNRLTGGAGFALSYDANGRVTGSNGLTITRDAAGRISAITYAAGKAVTYTYDSRGLLSRISDWTGGGMFFNFDDAHRMTSQRAANGVLTAYSYDKDSRLINISQTGGLVSLGSVSMTRDAIGRVTAVTRKMPQDLIAAPSTLSQGFDSADQVVGATYDAHGRLTGDAAGAAYKWSASSRLLSYSLPNGSAASATYDGLGQRILRTVGAATQNFVLNYATDLPTVATIQLGKADVRYFIYTPEGLLLYSVEAGSSAHHYYSFDETGTTTFLTDNSGEVSDAYGISEYGEIITVAPYNTADNPFTWQGQFGVMQDQGTKLYYVRDRYYDGATAWFVTRDPVFMETAPAAPAEVNPYQYAAGNPVANHDPTGLKTLVLPVAPAIGATKVHPVIKGRTFIDDLFAPVLRLAPAIAMLVR